MRDGRIIDLGMNAYEELFMNDKQRAENKLPKIYDIPISQIDPFPDHPFQVKEDEDMWLLVDSIKEQGVITPITVRAKDDGRYEIVSGHRRTRACELAGLQTVKAEIRELTRDEAVILMVDSNCQRTTLLPSEKAKSYKMKMDAMKRTPGRPQSNRGPLVHDYDGRKTRDIIAEEGSDSARQIQRYIRLNELIPEILDMVDEGRVGFRPAVEISYLSKKEQKWLLNAIEYTTSTPSLSQALKIRELSKKGELTEYAIEECLSVPKPNQKDKINIKYEQARKYIPANVPYEKTGDFIMKALEYYHRHLERQKGNSR